MGMNFTQDDAEHLGYAKMYSATVASDDGKLVSSTSPEAGLERATPSSDHLRRRPASSVIKYLNDAGTALKTETRSRYPATPGVRASRNKMSTTPRAGSRLTRKSWKVNEQ
jgi:hypothetical protein